MAEYESLTTPEEELASHPSESDAAALADELGQIGVHTVDGDKIAAPVERINIVDTDTVRLWYRFPTGELIPEEFDRPLFWDVTESKLARVVDHAGLQAELFSELEKRDDIEVVLEETRVDAESVDLEELAEVAPTLPNDDVPVKDRINQLYFESSDEEDEYVTWQAADPCNLVDDDRYDPSSESDEETDHFLSEWGVEDDFVGATFGAGFIGFIALGILALLASGLASLVGVAVPAGSALLWIGVFVMAVLVATMFTRLEPE